MLEPDSSDYEGSPPSTASLISRHLHTLQLQVNTLEAHVRACERRIRSLEAQELRTRAESAPATWAQVLLRPFSVCFFRSEP